MEKISLVMPAYNEEASIGEVVRDFQSLEQVEEIIVADNNSEDETASVAKENGAKVVEEDRQGYGYSMKAAMDAATKDVIVTVESDSTYSSKDLEKLIAYSSDFDIVLGERTNTALIEENAKMGFFLRTGNKFLGKIVEILFSGPTINDVGCSYRLFRRDSLDRILENEVRGADLYSPQIILVALKNDLEFVQIPVNYKKRVGESKLTNTLTSSSIIGVKMLNYILKEGLKHRMNFNR